MWRNQSGVPLTCSPQLCPVQAWQIPRRAKTSEEGFDALGIVAVRCRNDGTPVEIWLDPPAPQPGDIFEYDAMVSRVADAYEARFK